MIIESLLEHIDRLSEPAGRFQKLISCRSIKTFRNISLHKLFFHFIINLFIFIFYFFNVFWISLLFIDVKVIFFDDKIKVIKNNILNYLCELICILFFSFQCCII